MSSQTIKEWLEKNLSGDDGVESSRFLICRTLGFRSRTYQSITSLEDLDGEPLSIPDDIGYVHGYFMAIADSDFAARDEAKLFYRLTIDGKNSDGRFICCKHIMRGGDDGQD